MPKAPREDRLQKYRDKRAADRTPEPFGGGEPQGVIPAGGPRLFVVQKHAARRMHWDFRLEWGGVLWSWAVPQGPSADPTVKRLAVEVEDHPVEYADFEGIIPKDNYGAGAVILWDRGSWTPVEEPGAGRERGKLLFDLSGYKMRGRWTLVRTKRGAGAGPSKEWLLIKKADAHAAKEGERPYPQESILSGLTVEELRDGPARAAEVAQALEEAGAVRRTVTARAQDLMLAQTAAEPPGQPGWIFEIKYDGYRLLASRQDGRARLQSRGGGDATDAFPEVARAVSALPFDELVLDGELTVADEQGRPAFSRLQKRFLLRRRAEVERASVETPAVLWVFDVLGVGGLDARDLPLLVRKQILRKMLPRAGPVRFVDHVEGRGAEMLEAAKALGLEGIMAKRADSRYRAGRSRDWLKVKLDETDDFVVVGYTRPARSRVGFGALHVARSEDGGPLVYAGKVGTGLSDELLGSLRARLDARRRDRPACEGAPRGRGHVWVEPEIVIEVRYKERTADGQLRHPTFLREREEGRISASLAAPDEPSTIPAGASGASDRRPHESKERKVAFTNLDKVFWPEDGTTKGDLVRYYRSAWRWLGRYLADRPLVMTRYPDGITGKSFFQKDAPAWAPEWVRRERMWSDPTSREIDYFICDDVESLEYVINMGCIPLHVWSSRVATIGQPDWCILDLDPKGAPFEHVVALALAARALCEDIELPAFVKSSGSTGLHVLVPLGGACTFDHAKILGEILAKVIEAEHPDISTTERIVSARGGRVYLDFLQNGRGKLLVAPLSVRPLPGAPVSTPLLWQEVDEKLDIRAHTIRTMERRMDALGDDPLAPVLSERPDLARALGRLRERWGHDPGE